MYSRLNASADLFRTAGAFSVSKAIRAAGRRGEVEGEGREEKKRGGRVEVSKSRMLMLNQDSYLAKLLQDSS